MFGAVGMKHFFDRPLALAPRDITAVGSAVFEVKTDDPVVEFFENGDRREAFAAGDVVADMEVEPDGGTQLQEGIGFVHGRVVARVVVEGDPDIVFGGEGREFLGHGIGALGGNTDAAEGLGGLKIERDLFVRGAEGDFVERKINPGVVVEFAELTTLRGLGRAGGFGGFFGGRGRGGLLFRSGGGDADAGELQDGPAHEFDFAKAAWENPAQPFPLRMGTCCGS